MNLPWLSRACASGPAAPASPSTCVTARHPACDLHLAGGGTVDRTAGRTHRCACLCWPELDRSVAADVAGPLIGHAQYAPTAWVGRMHAEPARRANHRMVAIRGPWIEGIGETHEA
jgi:hypothetical protein